MNRTSPLVAFAFALLCSSVAAAGPAGVERYALVTSTGPIGLLTVSRTVVEGGVGFDNEWRVDDNGRGPKIKEHVELGASGLPRHWLIEGKAWVGAPVKEQFDIAAGKAKWQSLDDSGEAAGGEDALYLANNGTPWALGLYARALLHSKGNTRSVLPGGTLHLEKIKEVEIGDKVKERVTAYAIWGLGGEPAVVLMSGDRFVGTVAAGWVFIDEKHQGSYPALSALGGELSGLLLEALTKKVTHSVEGPLWLTNVRVFDANTQKVSAPASVVVFRGKIVGVRKDAPPKGALVVDGRGGTLLPGLVDAHAHLWDWAGPYHIAAGVTFSRDPGNDNDTILALTDKIDRGLVLGPRNTRSGFLEGKSPFSASGGFIVDTEAEALEKVRWFADHGFSGVKIYNSMNPAFVKGIATEAHRLGMHVSGHIPAFMSVEQAVRDGYNEIHHINMVLLSYIIDVKKDDTRTPFRFTALGERTGDLDLKRADVQALITLMKQKNVSLDPTMTAFAGLLLARPGKVVSVDAGWLDHMPVPTQRARKTAVLDIKPEQYPTYEKSWKKIEEMLLLLHKEGIPLMPGTDDQAGFILHSELEAWVKAGIPAPAALASATIGAARLLGWDQQLGSIEAGKLADLYLVDGDPTKDITALRRGTLVMKGTSVYYPDEIHAALGVKPFAAHAPLPK